MTMQQIDAGYLAARIMAQLSPDDQSEVYEACGDAAVELWEEIYPTLIGQAGLKKGPPAERQKEFDERLPQEWDQLRALSPKDFDADMADWHQLKEREANRAP